MEYAKEQSVSGGYSLVEVLIAVVVTTVGLLALINLQVGTLHAVNSSKNLTLATNMAEHFLESLKAEGVAWNTDATVMLTQTATFPRLRFVGNPVEGGGSGWLRAYLSTGLDKRVGPMGNDSLMDNGIFSEVPGARNRSFCLHYRLTWVVPDYLIRADVRALWLRNEADVSLYQDCPVGMEADLANVSSVSVPGMIMRNIFASE